MKSMYFLIFAASSLFATVSAFQSPTSSTMIEGGALAILGWTVWYSLARALPRERNEFLQAQDNTRRDFRRSLHKLAMAIEKLTLTLSGKE